MKKLLFSALSCLVIVSLLSSCNKKKDEPADTTVADEKTWFTLEYTDVTATQATVSVKPADPAMTYYFDIVQSAIYHPDTVVSPYTKEYLDALIEYYSDYGYDISGYVDFFSMGNDSYDYENLTPDTEYTIFAFGFDTTTFKVCTPVETRTFRTDKMEIKGQKELTFTDIEFVNAVKDEGWWQIMGDTKAVNNKFMFISVSPKYAETVTGTYTMADMDTRFTLLADYTINGNDTVVDAYIDFVTGVFEVTETDAGATMEAVVVGNDGYQYTIHANGILKERDLEDEGDEDDEWVYAPARRKSAARIHAVRRNKGIRLNKTFGLKK